MAVLLDSRDGGRLDSPGSSLSLLGGWGRRISLPCMSDNFLLHIMCSCDTLRVGPGYTAIVDFVIILYNANAYANLFFLC